MTEAEAAQRSTVVSKRVAFGTARLSAATVALDLGFGTWPRIWPSPNRGEHIASTSFLRPAHLTPCVANFLTLKGL